MKRLIIILVLFAYFIVGCAIYAHPPRPHPKPHPKHPRDHRPPAVIIIP